MTPHSTDRSRAGHTRPDPAPADPAQIRVRRAQEGSHHHAVDAASCEDLAGRLYGLLVRFGDWLDHRDARQLHHFIDVGEYGLALEEIADALAPAKTPVTDQERGGMLALAATMKLDDLVPRARGSARALPLSRSPCSRGRLLSARQR